MTFQNSVVGGVTLVRPAIQSPDYDEGVAGWTVNQDGSAEFNDIVIRGGTVVSGLALYYDGPPAAGNLILSIAASAGVDAYGNEYDQGLTVHDSSGSKIIMEAGGGSSTISFLPRAIPGIDWNSGGVGQALSTRLGTNTPQMFAASPFNKGDPSSSAISFYGSPEVSNGDVKSEVIMSGARTTITSVNVWLTASPIQMYDGNTFNTFAPVVTGGGSVTWTARTGWWQRIGKMIFVSMRLVVNAAGSGTATVGINLPTTANGDTDQILTARFDENRTGYALKFQGSNSALLDRIRMQDATGVNRVANVTGADLTTGRVINIEGWYREA